MASIPASGVVLTALGSIRVLSRPDPNAEEHQYATADLPRHSRPYLVGEPLGQSLGRTETGTDGQTYLTIESYRWKAITVILGIVIDKGREFRTSYIRLDERDQTWRVELPGGVGQTEADAIDQFLRNYRENYLTLANWQGIPEPIKVEVYSNNGVADFRLTYAGGGVVVWSTFKDVGLPEKLSLLKSGPTLPTPGPDGDKTSNLLAYLAGGGVLLLMGVVIVLQYLQKRRKATTTNG